MSYTNETTHYSIPLPLGTDLTTPMDYNASMQDLDTAVFGAVTDASAGVQKANAVEEALGTTNDNLSALTGRVTSAEGTITTQGNAITQLQLDVADVKADALDMICAVDEGTAQVASVAVQTGKYFRYNDVLYMATADIAIGDTIVPNTNCRATNSATELETLNTEVAQLDPSNYVNVNDLAISLITGSTSVGIDSKSYTATEDTFVTIGGVIDGEPSTTNQWLLAEITITRSGVGHTVAYNNQYNINGSTAGMHQSASFTGMLSAGDTITVNCSSSTSIAITRSYYSNVPLS